MRNLATAFLLIFILQGCTALPATFAPDQTGRITRPQGSLQSIFVASSRNRLPDGSFGIERAQSLSFATYQVAMPNRRAPGSIPPEPFGTSNEFASLEVARQASLSAFSATVLDAARTTRNSSEVMVFVHGFNSSFEHSLTRVAQMDKDFEFPSATILYAWPAANQLLSYVHDLDSTAFARDGLVELLSGLSRSGISRIVVVGHSMGARLAMEAVRDLALEGNRRFFEKLGGVALLSPDIDVDLFTAQLRTLEGFAPSVVAYISSDDPTLRDFSNFFIEGKLRLGSIQDISRLGGQAATIVDVNNVGDPAQRSHLAVATSPVMIGDINAMSRPDLIRYAQGLTEYPNATVSRFGKTVGIQLAPY
ncbi:MAG TPA: alpha/beta fold hydrolase [Devosia sp.]|nr:alpha/beta fold hydrolase [Devosia sp.]